MEDSLLTHTERYAAVSLFALALHRSHIHQFRPSNILGGLEEEPVGEGASIGGEGWVSDRQELWIHDKSGLLWPVLSFLPAKSVAPSARDSSFFSSFYVLLASLSLSALPEPFLTLVSMKELLHSLFPIVPRLARLPQQQFHQPSSTSIVHKLQGSRQPHLHQKLPHFLLAPPLLARHPLQLQHAQDSGPSLLGAASSAASSTPPLFGAISGFLGDYTSTFLLSRLKLELSISATPDHSAISHSFE
ncbi:hypothetical protein SAY87_003569 [Trapa incisa]|uniref:Uncharacterized protein n=1 Tax=Trapa incisa TaxID=236973 RepID=A0AAN7KPK0_9MYRT|nr:hypothetical protein SAY87_003569 [Trapa incisa]